MPETTEAAPPRRSFYTGWVVILGAAVALFALASYPLWPAGATPAMAVGPAVAGEATAG